MRAPMDRGKVTDLMFPRGSAGHAHGVRHRAKHRDVRQGLRSEDLRIC